MTKMMESTSVNVLYIFINDRTNTMALRATWLTIMLIIALSINSPSQSFSLSTFAGMMINTME